MSKVGQYRFEVGETEAVEEFIRKYVLGAIERVADYESSERVSFAPAGTNGRDSVVFVVWGDPETVMEKERSHIEPHLESGLLDDWALAQEWSAEEFESMMGEQTAALNNRIGELSAEMAKLAYEEFDSFPAAVDTYPDEDAGAGPIGWWGVLHNLTVQVNYDLDEELDAYRYGIEHTLRNFGEYHGEDAVDQRIDELKQALEDMRDEAKSGRLGP
jgi:hypothetical protein